MTAVSISRRQRLVPLLLCVLGLLVAQLASAKSGGVDYSWGAGALAKAHDYTVTMMLYVLYVCYAVGSVMAIISAQSSSSSEPRSSSRPSSATGYRINRNHPLGIRMTGAHVGTDAGR